MKRAALRCPAVALVVALVAGCTSEQVYNSAQGWRRNECNKLGDQAQRERCLKEEADRPYSSYSTDRGAASAPSR